jgi:hypothetical protein
MKNKKVLVSFWFACLLSSSIFATSITSIVCGNWSAPSTWNLNRTPLPTDTVIVNSFVSFDVDFTSTSPGFLNVTVCGALCGSHNYTGNFLFDGTVFLNTLTADYGHSVSTSSVNIQQSATVINSGTSYDVTAGSVCVGCTSTCQNCSASRTDSTNCLGTVPENKIAEANLRIFPNPANNNLSISSTKELGTISIYNNLGEIVLCVSILSGQTQSKPNPNSSQEGKLITTDVSKLQPGIYFIQTKLSDKVYASKFVKE